MLDTNMVNYILNGNPQVTERYKSVETETFVGGIVVEEILIAGFGAEINNIRSGKSKADLGRTFADFHKRIDALARFQKLPYTNDAEAVFRLLKSGKGSAKVKAIDGRIAAHTLSLGMILVTENVADFESVAGLTVENWAR
ncbi:MAG: hypothetical protein H7Y38_19190 [Armatimonadetes bacterium]|nr:hypothetical protein [Armatimonadota bacterium]